MIARYDDMRREMETGGNLPGFRKAVEEGDPRPAATILREMDLVPFSIDLSPDLPPERLARNLCALVIEHALNFVTYDEEMRDTVVRALMEAEDAARGTLSLVEQPAGNVLPTQMPDIDARDGSLHPDEPPVPSPHDPASMQPSQPPAGPGGLFPPSAGRRIAAPGGPRGAVDTRTLFAALPPLPSPPSARGASAPTWITGRPWSQSGWGIDIPEQALGAEQAVELQNRHAQDPGGFLAQVGRVPFAETDPPWLVREASDTFRLMTAMAARNSRPVPGGLVAIFEDRLVGVLEEAFPGRLAAMREVGASFLPGGALEKVLQAAAGALAWLHDDLAVFGAQAAGPDGRRLPFRQIGPGHPVDFGLLLDTAIIDNLAVDKPIVEALQDALGQAAHALAYPHDRDMASASAFLTAFDADPLQTLEAVHGRADFPAFAPRMRVTEEEVPEADADDDPEP